MVSRSFLLFLRDSFFFFHICLFDSIGFIIYSLEFSHQRKLMLFHWRLSDSKSPQVSRTLLSILVVFNNAVVWMVSTRSPTSKSSRPFNNPLVTVPKAPITIGIFVTFIFHRFFQFSSKVDVLISLFTFIPCKSFTSALADDILQESERQQVFTSFQYYSQYSGRF